MAYNWLVLPNIPIVLADVEDVDEDVNRHILVILMQTQLHMDDNGIEEIRNNQNGLAENDGDDDELLLIDWRIDFQL
ncbi:hypothetical protein BLOT_005264 [Blomia tropicalis]|nr:hypothetical protein BLOT_005264 [Blomia tropicalis]